MTVRSSAGAGGGGGGGNPFDELLLTETGSPDNNQMQIHAAYVVDFEEDQLIFQQTATTPESSVSYKFQDATGTGAGLVIFGNTSGSLHISATDAAGEPLAPDQSPLSVVANSLEVANFSASGESNVSLATINSELAALSGANIAVYNLGNPGEADYERVKLDWSSNVARLWTQNDGSGSPRVLQAGVSFADAGTAPITYTQWSASSFPFINHVFINTTSGTALQHQLASGTLSSNSGTQTSVGISPTFAQTGTAAGVALLVNPSGTFGSGGGKLQSWQLGGSERAYIDSAGNFRQIPVTVASLTAAATAGAGARAMVSDATAPVFGSAVVGGGAVVVPVYSTGSAWHVG